MVMAFPLDGNAFTVSAVFLVCFNDSAELLQTALEVARFPVLPTLHLSGSSRRALGGEEMYPDLQGNGEPPRGFGAFHADVARCLLSCKSVVGEMAFRETRIAALTQKERYFQV